MRFVSRRHFVRAVQSLATAAGLVCVCALPAAAATDWTPVQDALHADGVVMPGDVLRFNLVRSDLNVTVAGKPVSSAEVANGYLNFEQVGSGDNYFVDGALPAIDWQADYVARALRMDGHISISAIVNHTAKESPSLLWVHFEGMGTQAALTSAIAKALAVIKNPQIGVKTQWVNIASYVPKNFQAIFQKGTIAQVNDVFAFALPRPDESQYFLGNVPGSPALGVAETVFVSAPGGNPNNLIFNAEFALRADEIQPVSDVLRAGGFFIPAQHDHFIDDHVRLYFVHAFGWGNTAMQEQALLKVFAWLYAGH